jgi:trimethylamine:corrinoid methyltransferase-like protein
MRSTLLAIPAIALNISFPNPGVAGESIRCNCLFEQSSGYTAVGTKAVCSTMTHKNREGKGEHCEISFGAAGSEAPQISRLGGNSDIAFQLTERNLEAIRSRNLELVSDAGYLKLAIPAYLRAVYAREGAQLDFGTKLDLDKQIVEITI